MKDIFVLLGMMGFAVLVLLASVQSSGHLVAIVVFGEIVLVGAGALWVGRGVR